ncbi:MAG: TolC family protein [Candidatus Marinimicrobia bacterium]|nr:TolC family protein [Candidatus Neomarinimicrobiota bacterium]
MFTARIILLTALLGPGLLLAQAAGGLTLDQLLDIGLSNNSNIKIAERNLRVAQADRRGSFSGIAPRLSATFNKNPNPGTLVNPATNLLETLPDLRSSIMVSYTIFDGARSWYNVSSGRNQVDRSGASLQVARQQTVLFIKQAYFNYLSVRALLEVAGEALILSGRQLNLVQERFKLQAVRETDLLKAKVSTGQRSADVHIARQRLAEAGTRLNMVLGIDPLAPINIADKEVVLAQLPSREQSFARLASSNPQLQAQVYAVRGSKLSAKMQRGVLLPTVRISYGTGQAGSTFSETLKRDALNANGVTNISLSIPLFTGMRNTSSYSRARYSAMAEEERLSSMERDLRRQLENTLSNLETLLLVHPINQEVLASAEADVRLAEEQYNLGAISILDLLNAQVSLITAKSTLVRTNYDIKSAEAQLEALTGTSIK